MIKGLVFNQAFWIQKTNDVANKLNNYDNLQNQVNSLQSEVDSVNSKLNSLNGEYIFEAYDARQTLIIRDGRLYFQEPQVGNYELVELKKGQIVSIDILNRDNS